MKKYLNHIKNKTTHERRQHAMQLSMGIVAVIFVAWLATIGVRFAAVQSSGSQNADQGDTSSQLANVVSGAGGVQATLIVATSTDNTNQ